MGFTTPDFRWFPDTQVGSKPRGQLRGTNHSNKGTMFSFFKSYYVAIRPSFFSAAESDRRLKLIVSHFRRFGLTIHTGSRKAKTRKRRPFTFRPGQESSAADMEDIEIDADRFMSFASSSNILLRAGTQWHRDITERISQARKLFGSMNKQLLGNKNTDRYPSQALSSDCCEYSTLGKRAGHWKTDRSKLEAFHHECLRKMCGLTMWDVAEKRITNEHVRGMVANSPTMDTLMETRRCRWLSNSVQWKSQDLRAHGVRQDQ
jgi:hypothetical protein